MRKRLQKSLRTLVELLREMSKSGVLGLGRSERLVAAIKRLEHACVTKNRKVVDDTINWIAIELVSALMR